MTTLLCKICDREIFESEFEFMNYMGILRKKMIKVYIINILLIIIT